MKQLFFFFSFFMLLASVQAQTIVNPKDFPAKATADGSEAIYTREDNVNRKVTFPVAKKYFTPNVNTSLISYTPTSTGNVNNLTEFVKHNTSGKIWYIDGAGDAFLLYDPTITASSVEFADSTVIFVTPTQLMDSIALIVASGVSDGDKGDITVSSVGTNWQLDAGVVGATEISSTAVTPGSYTLSSVTVDADGRITAASNGSVVTDSTRLVQDSILVYYQGGIEVGRDTITGTGGSGTDTNLFSGDLTQTVARTQTLLDNNIAALVFSTAGKAGLLTLRTLDGQEAVITSGNLAVSGNTEIAGQTYLGDNKTDTTAIRGTLVLRDSANSFAGAYVGLKAMEVGTPYTLTLPGNQGASGETLVNDGSGGLSWASGVADTLNTGRTLYVSLLLGNDATAEVGNISRPWRRPEIAVQSMIDGDVMNFLDSGPYILQSGIYIDSLQNVTFRGNNAVLKRPNYSKVGTTLETAYAGGNYIYVDSIPEFLIVGDLVYISEDSSNADLSQPGKVTAIDSLTATRWRITLLVPLGVNSGRVAYTTTPAPIGADLFEGYEMIYGRPSAAEGHTDPAGANRNITITGLIFDGNRDSSSVNFGWHVNGTIQLQGRGSKIEKNVFRNIPNENIFGHGFIVTNNTCDGGNGSFVHTSANDGTFSENSYSIVTDNIVKNFCEMDYSINLHNEGVLSFSNNGGYQMVANNYFENATAAFGALGGLPTDTHSRENFFAQGNYLKNMGIFNSLNSNFKGLNVSNNTFDDCGTLNLTTNNRDTVTTWKICNNLSLNGTVLTTSNYQKCDPVTGGTTLNGAYANFGTDPTEVNVNKGKALEWNQKAATDDFWIDQEVAGAEWGVRQFGVAGKEVIKSVSGDLTMRTPYYGDTWQVQNPDGNNYIYISSANAQTISFNNSIASGADSLVNFGLAGLSGWHSYGGAGAKWNYKFDQKGNTSSFRFATLWDFGNLNDTGNGYGLFQPRFTLNGSGNFRRYTVWGTDFINVAITGSRIDTLGFLQWNPTITSTGGGFENMPIDIVTGKSFWRDGTDVYIMGALRDSTGSAGANNTFAVSTATGWKWRGLLASDIPDIGTIYARLGGNTGAVTIGSNDNTLALETNGTTRMTIGTTGQIKFDNYTGTTFNATRTANLGVDASGNVIKEPLVFGELIDTAGVSTLVLTAATPAKFATFLSGNVSNVTYSAANDRLTIDANMPTQKYLVTFAVSGSSSASNIILNTWVYKNGQRVTRSVSERKISTGGDVGNWGGNCIVELAATDYIELFFQSDSNTTITSRGMNVTLIKL